MFLTYLKAQTTANPPFCSPLKPSQAPANPFCPPYTRDNDAEKRRECRLRLSLFAAQIYRQALVSKPAGFVFPKYQPSDDDTDRAAWFCRRRIEWRISGRSADSADRGCIVPLSKQVFCAAFRSPAPDIFSRTCRSRYSIPPP